MSMWEPSMPKNECQVQRSWDAMDSSITVHPLACPLYCPCQANGQFFHSQYIQSIFPVIPGNPLVSLKAKSRRVSSALGALGNSLPKTATTALKNLYIASRQVDSFMRK